MELTPSARQSCVSANLVAGLLREVLLEISAFGFLAVGRRLPAIANARERRTDADALLFTRLTIMRATDRRRYERGLIEARKESDELNTALEKRLQQERENAELRETFIAVLGHDLRNPLASIAAGARLMLKAKTLEEALRLEAMMQSSVARMAKMIESVMDLPRGRLGGGISLSRDHLRH
jgi:phosphoserine phosphatase RsbU/P